MKDKLAEEYFRNLKKASQGFNCAEGGNIKNKIWILKKHMCPRSRDPPTAMVNNQGKLVTDKDVITKMAKETYSERLRNRSIREGLVIKDAKEILA